MVDWQKIREDFPVTGRGAYFISAGMSPLPTPVFQHIVAGYRALNEGGDTGWKEDCKRNNALRETIGRLINASGDDIAFTQNSSLSMSIVALSLKQRHGKGFNVVSMLDEFPATTVPLEYQDIEVRYVEPVNGRYPVEAVLEKVNRQTVAVVTSFVQYATGFRQDLAALGHELEKCGTIFVVNATQGFPLFLIDVAAMHIDALTASAHKWGFAGHIGAVFYTSAEFRQRYPSPMAGWLSVKPDEGQFIYTGKGRPLNLKETAERYSFGTNNLQTVNALAVSLGYLEDIGFEAIRERLFELGDYLVAGLTSLGVDLVTPVGARSERSAITSFGLSDRTAALASFLRGEGIYVSYRNGNVRVALNIFNNREDIDRLFDAIRRYLDAPLVP